MQEQSIALKQDEEDEEDLTNNIDIQVNIKASGSP